MIYEYSYRRTPKVVIEGDRVSIDTITGDQVILCKDGSYRVARGDFVFLVTHATPPAEISGEGVVL